MLALLPSYPVWLVLRLMIGVILTLVFIIGESWINQLVVEQWRGRLVALYGSSLCLKSAGRAGVAGFSLGPITITAFGSASAC